MRREKITPENYRAALAVSVHPDQEDLVAPVVNSLAEAYAFGDNAWPRLIRDGDRPVGFVIAFLDIPWDHNPDDLRSSTRSPAVAGRGARSFPRRRGNAGAVIAPGP